VGAAIAILGVVVSLGIPEIRAYLTRPKLRVGISERMIETLRHVSADTVETAYAIHDAIMNCHEALVFVSTTAHGRDTTSSILADLMLVVSNDGGRPLEDVRIPVRAAWLRTPEDLIRSPNIEAHLTAGGMGPDSTIGWIVHIDRLPRQTTGIVTLRQRLPMPNLTKLQMSLGDMSAANFDLRSKDSFATEILRVRQALASEKTLFGVALQGQVLGHVDVHTHDHPKIRAVFPGDSLVFNGTPMCRI